MTRAPLLAERYVLGDPLGDGPVYACRDTVTGEALAVKLLPVPDATSRARILREVTALRWLRLPGVVRLRDDGIQDGTWFVVMDRVHGEPFPTARTRWEILAPRLVDLLSTLDAVHRAGVVHRDLKPGNVLVGERVTVLDFGLARGRAIGVSRGRAEGTPRYVAPEQLCDAPVDARSDLYAVGAMAYHALTGRPPHQAASVQALLQARLAVAPAPVGDLAPVPLRVGRALDAMLNVDPQDRPATAAEVLAELGVPSLEVRIGERVQTLGAGPALFSADGVPPQLARDAAEVLGRCPGPPAHELARWVRRGAAWLDGDFVAVDDLGLERVEAEPERDRDSAQALVERARALLDQGRHAGCLARVHAALALATDRDVVRRALEVGVESALAQEAPAPLDRALSLLGRARTRGVPAEDLRGLTRAALHAVRRERERALQALERVPALENERLEVWRVATRLRAEAPRGADAVGALLDELEATWATTPTRRARLLGWRGLHRYQVGDYPGSVGFHLQSAAARARDHERVFALRNAASAALEAGSLEQCIRLSAQVEALARGLRLHGVEAAATWLGRAARYRRADALVPQVERVLAERALGSAHHVASAITEAAIAWRADSLADARALAMSASRAAWGRGLVDAACLADALARVAGAPLDPEALAAKARLGRVPEVMAQTLALLALAGEVPDREPDCARALRARGLSDDRRLDVLSPGEVSRALSGGMVASGGRNG